VAKHPIRLALDPQAQALLDHFCALLGIRIALYDADGRELACGLQRGSCAFCSLLRKELGREAACRREDRFRFAQARASGGLTAYRCHAGLEEAILPIRVDGVLLGHAMIGQYRGDAPLSTELIAGWKRTVGDGRLAAAYAAVPSHPSAPVLGLFHHLVDALIVRRLVEVAREPGLMRVLRRLRERPAGQLDLAGAAALAGTSTATLDRGLRAATGVGFKALQISLRLAVADAELARGGTVAEAATAAGYADPLYFSRLYRRHRGLPPSASRPTA
jgi:AraC-like DNA-binding protein